MPNEHNNPIDMETTTMTKNILSKFVFLSILAILLTAVGATVVQSAKAVGTVESTAADESITANVKKTMGASKDITVNTQNGAVTLTGTVDTEALKQSAVANARAVTGVKSVTDKLGVKGGTSQTVGEYIDDTGITTAVKSKILAEKGLASFEISVTTKNGVVTLRRTALNTPSLLNRSPARLMA